MGRPNTVVARSAVAEGWVRDGHGDPPLDPVGVQQAELLADRLQHEQVDAIYVTTLTRTAETAAAEPSGSATASDTTPMNTAPALSLIKSDGGATVTPGNPIIYTLDYANTGNVELTGVQALINHFVNQVLRRSLQP